MRACVCVSERAIIHKRAFPIHTVTTPRFPVAIQIELNVLQYFFLSKIFSPLNFYFHFSSNANGVFFRAFSSAHRFCEVVGFLFHSTTTKNVRFIFTVVNHENLTKEHWNSIRITVEMAVPITNGTQRKWSWDFTLNPKGLPDLAEWTIIEACDRRAHMKCWCCRAVMPARTEFGDWLNRRLAGQCDWIIDSSTELSIRKTKGIIIPLLSATAHYATTTWCWTQKIPNRATLSNHSPIRFLIALFVAASLDIGVLFELSNDFNQKIMFCVFCFISGKSSQTMCDW